MRVETEFCDLKAAVISTAGDCESVGKKAFTVFDSNTYLTYRHLILQVSFVCPFLLYPHRYSVYGNN